MTRLQTIPRFDLAFTPADFWTGLTFLLASRPPGEPEFHGLIAPGRGFWTGSGRQALWLLLKALRLRPGSGVAVPLFSDPAVAKAVRDARLTPVFVDIDEQTLTMDPASLEDARSRVSAVVAVHLFGQVAPLDAIREAAPDRPMIEDTVHAPLSRYRDRLVGSFGVGSLYSFGSSKCLPAGGGGLAVTADPELEKFVEAESRVLVPARPIQRVRKLLGQTAKAFVFRRPLYGLVGLPLRPLVEQYQLLEPELDRTAIHPGHAAIVLRQIERIRQRMAAQRRTSLRLLRLLSGLEDVVLPWERPACQYNFHLFPVLLRNSAERAAVAALMLKRHVDTSWIYYDVVEQSVQLGYEHDAPRSESAARRLLTLPNHPSFSESEAAYVAEAFRDAVNTHRARTASRRFVAVQDRADEAGGRTPAPAQRTVERRREHSMKVLQFLCGRAWGGGSVVVLAITRAMIARGDNVCVFSFEEENDRRFREAGARIIRAPFWFHPINPLDAAVLLHVRRMCRRERFDLVVTHTSKGGFLGRLAARMAGVPHIVHHAHGFAFNRPLGSLGMRFYVGLERLAARAGDQIIAVNEEQRRMAIHLGVDTADRISTVHNGIDLGLFERTDRDAVRRHLGFDGSDVVIGAVGRLAPQKGLIHLIQAFPMVFEQAPKAHLVIAGDGPLEAELREEARRSGAGAHIHFLGFRRDIPDLLAAFDLFVQPSLWEGLSISLIEALAAGKPIVASDIESSREVIEHERTGLLVAPGDPVALALAIERLLLRPEAARGLAERARDAARERFSQERMVKQVLDVYDRVAAAGRQVGSRASIASEVTEITRSR